MNGYILWEGQSRIDGSPIVVVATGFGRASKNAKTGRMVQTWILPRDHSPVDAVRSGRDSAVCGDCKHRPSTGGACYVNVAQAPQAVWKAYQRGAYPHAHPKMAGALAAERNLPVRLGAWGDPAAVPERVWLELVSRTTGWTGYTHQWKWAIGLRGLCMASVDNPAERRLAQSMGWRTFEVVPRGTVPAGSVECPADGAKRSCSTCKLCMGGAKQAKSIHIEVHGTKAARFEQRASLAIVE